MKKIIEYKLKNQNVYLVDKYWRNLKINNFFSGLNNSENKIIKEFKIPTFNLIEEHYKEPFNNLPLLTN